MVDFRPPGWHAVTPRILTDDVRGLVAFLKTVFDATGEYRTGVPAEMKIDNSVIMVSGEGERAPMPAFLYVYVKDADETYERALDTGGVSIEAPTDTPYGDRRAMVRDSWGNLWQIATYRRRDRAD